MKIQITNNNKKQAINDIINYIKSDSNKNKDILLHCYFNYNKKLRQIKPNNYACLLVRANWFTHRRLFINKVDIRYLSDILRFTTKRLYLNEKITIII